MQPTASLLVAAFAALNILPTALAAPFYLGPWDSGILPPGYHPTGLENLPALDGTPVATVPEVAYAVPDGSREEPALDKSKRDTLMASDLNIPELEEPCECAIARYFATGFDLYSRSLERLDDNHEDTCKCAENPRTIEVFRKHFAAFDSD
ncbi:hypothetical protein B0A50_08703 [Salinomyces thailandicus]|uniref:Uncharacterized protein n=1 Tax=Salinomyces thailandicus TaxID=706561 RepID=A0A4U0TJD5_9PEZI|nr:hypothetical protein B0A50_08703 [Salinomyces thailandica]